MDYERMMAELVRREEMKRQYQRAKHAADDLFTAGKQSGYSEILAGLDQNDPNSERFAAQIRHLLCIRLGLV